MKINATFWSNISKIIVTVIAIAYETMYIVLNRTIPPLDQQLSLAVFIGLIWTIWSPVDASKFAKNLKEIKEGLK